MSSPVGGSLLAIGTGTGSKALHDQPNMVDNNSSGHYIQGNQALLSFYGSCETTSCLSLSTNCQSSVAFPFSVSLLNVHYLLVEFMILSLYQSQVSFLGIIDYPSSQNKSLKAHLYRCPDPVTWSFTVARLSKMVND